MNDEAAYPPARAYEAACKALEQAKADVARLTREREEARADAVKFRQVIETVDGHMHDLRDALGYPRDPFMCWGEAALHADVWVRDAVARLKGERDTLRSAVAAMVSAEESGHDAMAERSALLKAMAETAGGR